MSHVRPIRRHFHGGSELDTYRAQATALRQRVTRIRAAPRAASIGMALVVLVATAILSRADMSESIATPGEVAITTVHAEGAQVYECRSIGDGILVWQFREPIATLLADGATVGRHFAGPSWELADGSAVTAKLAGRAPGATANDIPLLKLVVTSRREGGQLAAATTIQRINTRGGMLEGSCEGAGAMTSVPYQADYTFLRKQQ